MKKYISLLCMVVSLAMLSGTTLAGAAVNAPSDNAATVSDVNRQLCDVTKNHVSFIPYLKNKDNLGSDSAGGIKIFHSQIVVGKGKYDVANIYNYVGRNSDRVMAIYTGQFLTQSFYKYIASYYASNGYNVYIVERRETNIPEKESNVNNIMLSWDKNVALQDYAVSNAYIKIDSARRKGIKPQEVKLAILGHSLGGDLLVELKKTKDNKWSDRIFQPEYSVIIDTGIGFDPNSPDYQMLKDRQKTAAAYTLSEIQKGNGANADMLFMLKIASAAYYHPNDSCSIIQPVPGTALTNIQVFRLGAGSTSSIQMFPWHDKFCYWSYDPINTIFVPLPYANEKQLLKDIVVNKAAVCYSPNYLEHLTNQLLSEEEAIDSSNFNAKNCLYFGLGGGLGRYGAFRFQQLGFDVVPEWGNKGHAGIYNDKSAWQEINSWIKNKY